MKPLEEQGMTDSVENSVKIQQNKKSGVHPIYHRQQIVKYVKNARLSDVAQC